MFGLTPLFLIESKRLSTFEFCSTEYDDLDYQTPANELNEHVSYYKTQLKARETRRANGKDTSTEDPIVPRRDD